MKKTISITFLELEKLLKKREFLFGLLMSLVMGGGMAYGAYAFPESFGVIRPPFFRYFNVSTVI